MKSICRGSPSSREQPGPAGATHRGLHRKQEKPCPCPPALGRPGTRALRCTGRMMCCVSAGEVSGSPLRLQNYARPIDQRSLVIGIGTGIANADVTVLPESITAAEQQDQAFPLPALVNREPVRQATPVGPAGRPRRHWRVLSRATGTWPANAFRALPYGIPYFRKRVSITSCASIFTSSSRQGEYDA